MNLQYKGVNQRGRVVWIEKDLVIPGYPEGYEIEEWQVVRYRDFVECIQKHIGRELNTQELHSVVWLCGMDKSTEDHFKQFIGEAFQHGQASRNGKGEK